jgi:phosphohistidine swiveling domain-containing protein
LSKQLLREGDAGDKKPTAIGKGITASLGPEPPRYTGIALVAKSPKATSDITDRHILVVKETSPDYMFAMERALAIVTQVGGITSHAAITARQLRKPAVVGVEKLMKNVTNGEKIIIDVSTGIVYAS